MESYSFGIHNILKSNVKSTTTDLSNVSYKGILSTGGFQQNPSYSSTVIQKPDHMKSAGDTKTSNNNDIATGNHEDNNNNVVIISNDSSKTATSNSNEIDEDVNSNHSYSSGYSNNSSGSSNLGHRLVVDTQGPKTNKDNHELKSPPEQKIQKNHKLKPVEKTLTMKDEDYRKKTRTVFTRAQINRLESTFEKKRYLSSSERAGLSNALGLTETQVKIWFQNRRNKWKRKLLTAIEFRSLTLSQQYHHPAQYHHSYQTDLNAGGHYDLTNSSYLTARPPELPPLSLINSSALVRSGEDHFSRSIFPLPTTPQWSYPLRSPNLVFDFPPPSPMSRTSGSTSSFNHWLSTLNQLPSPYSPGYYGLGERSATATATATPSHSKNSSS